MVSLLAGASVLALLLVACGGRVAGAGDGAGGPSGDPSAPSPQVAGSGGSAGASAGTGTPGAGAGTAVPGAPSEPRLPITGPEPYLQSVESQCRSTYGAEYGWQCGDVAQCVVARCEEEVMVCDSVRGCRTVIECTAESGCYDASTCTAAMSLHPEVCGDFVSAYTNASSVVQPVADCVSAELDTCWWDVVGWQQAVDAGVAYVDAGVAYADAGYAYTDAGVAEPFDGGVPD